MMKDKLTRVRTQLILDEPFFGQLALRLPLVEDNSIPTAAVDGRNIFYNRDFIAGKSDAETKTILAHEVMHCVFDHVTRRGDRNPRKWNKAGDYVINLVLKNTGFVPVANWLFDTKYADMTADEVYSLLPGDGGGKGGTPGSSGEPMDDCRDADPDVSHEVATDWKIATVQAANQARAEGRLPSAMARFVDELTTPKLDWRAMLRRFITDVSKDDYSWLRPNRHFLTQGFFLPSLYSESMGEVVVVIDTSGSIDGPTLSAFGAEIKAIVDNCRPSATHVIYCDSAVNHVDKFTPDEELKFDAHGGGGTDFRPPFKYVEDNNIRPTCLVYLTDLYGPVGDEPEYPTMWVCTTNKEAPWGQTIPIDLA